LINRENIDPIENGRYLRQLATLQGNLNKLNEEARIVLATKYVKSLKTKTFSEVAGSEGAECTICLQGVMPQDIVSVLPCDEKHFLHQTCAIDWLAHSPSCPFCRKNFKETIARFDETKVSFTAINAVN